MNGNLEDMPTKGPKDRMVEAYLSGLSAAKAGKTVGYSESVCLSELKKRGIPVRKKKWVLALERGRKVCFKCKEEKTLDQFFANKFLRDGVTTWCRDCTKKSNKKWHDNNVEYHRGLNNEHYLLHKKEKHAKRMERLHTDPKARLIHHLRSRLNAFFGGKKPAHTMDLVGCSLEVLKAHIESLFTDGMTWGNYGEWHVDHIIPMAKIDLANPESIWKICHYTNLQPLWAKDNLTKGSKYEEQSSSSGDP